MQRARAAVLAATAALALGAGATAPAAAAGDPYPESEGWFDLTSDRVLPAGFACKVKIAEHDSGHVRFFEVSRRQNFQDFGEDAKAMFTNPKNGRSVTVATSGDGLFRSSKSGRTVRVTAFGASLFQGKGIRGLVAVNGVQRLKITQAGSQDEVLHLTVVNGTRKELCKQLGTKPVKGKNIVPDGSEAAAGPGRFLRR